jgi:hypothetical protein
MAKRTENRGPHFIGVGPGKTGTSWIHNHLSTHPNVIFPPLRELRYFWENANFPNRKFHQRLSRSDASYTHQYRDYFRHFLKRYSRNPARLFTNPKRLAWDCRYLFAQHSDNWYLGCFERKDGFVCGEISPQYYFLEEDEIKHIHDLLPDVQVIISLREPADWFWSLFRMHIPDYRRQQNDHVFDAFLMAMRAGCSFSKALRRWKKHFSDEQLLMVFYDELCFSPWQLYSKICGFLAIEPDPARLPQLATRVNGGNEHKLPDRFRKKIESAWRDDIEELSVMLPSLPMSWKSISEVSS